MPELLCPLFSDRCFFPLMTGCVSLVWALKMKVKAGSFITKMGVIDDYRFFKKRKRKNKKENSVNVVYSV